MPQPHQINDPAATATAIGSGPWLPVSRDLTSFTAVICDRSDLVVTTAPGAGHGSCACHIPAIATIELDAAKCFDGIDPATMRAADPVDHLRYPAGSGALRHEIAHALHTRWHPDPAQADAVCEAAVLLEEARVEYRRLTTNPEERQWLRASVRTLVAPALAAPPAIARADIAQAAHSAALLLGRVDAGVLTAEETTALRDRIRSVLPGATLSRLRRIWRRALHIADTDGAGMHKLARRWCRVLQHADNHTAGISITARTDAIAAAAAAAAEGIRVDLPAPAPRTPGGASTITSPAAARVFTPPPRHPSRAATPTERAAATRVARAFTVAATPSPVRITRSSAKPPGRLRMRGALAAGAQTAAGLPVTAEPWRQTTRSPAPRPHPRVGIALDISGSMRDWIGPACSAAWILAHAAASVGGTVAACAFATTLTPLIAPGTTPVHVPTPYLERATSHLPRGIEALDQAVALSRNDGHARLLVLITDGAINPNDTADTDARLTRLAATGCPILQLAPHNADQLPATTLLVTDDPSDTTGVITRAVAQALRRSTHPRT